MAKARRTKWTDELIEKRLAPHVARLGRMPSSNELRLAGDNAVACAVARHGGYLAWSRRLGLELKGSETHRGQRWERHEAMFFGSMGANVEEQTTKAPFDLLINRLRVDVKSANFGVYRNSKSGGSCSGYVFAGLRHGSDCDVFDLVCVSGDRVLYRYIVPAEHAAVQTLTITPLTIAGKGKYSPYLDAVEHLGLKRDGSAKQMAMNLE